MNLFQPPFPSPPFSSPSTYMHAYTHKHTQHIQIIFEYLFHQQNPCVWPFILATVKPSSTALSHIQSAIKTSLFRKMPPGSDVHIHLPYSIRIQAPTLSLNQTFNIFQLSSCHLILFYIDVKVIFPISQFEKQPCHSLFKELCYSLSAKMVNYVPNTQPNSTSFILHSQNFPGAGAGFFFFFSFP